jgi:hypothetical protein
MSKLEVFKDSENKWTTPILSPILSFLATQNKAKLLGREQSIIYAGRAKAELLRGYILLLFFFTLSFIDWPQMKIVNE